MYSTNNEELKHYGILGMRWGRRRTPEQLRAAAGKLETRNENLQRKYINNKNHASKFRTKAYSPLATRSMRDKRLYEAGKYEARAQRYLANMMKNKETISIFNNTADALDAGKVLKGNRFVMKYEQDTLELKI